jgi:hypothetical protein
LINSLLQRETARWECGKTVYPFRIIWILMLCCSQMQLLQIIFFKEVWTSQDCSQLYPYLYKRFCL